MASRLKLSPNATSLAILAIVVGFITIQTVVPIVKLFEPRPSRFGWHMYTGTRPRPTFAVVLADGQRQDVDIAPFFGERNGELDYAPAISSHLCATVAGVESVEINDAEAGETEIVACQ